MTFLNRLLAIALVILIWIDEGVQIILRGSWFLATGKGQPSAHETISAWLGMSRAAGKPVGTYLANLVDDMFGAGHCARAAAHEISDESQL